MPKNLEVNVDGDRTYIRPLESKALSETIRTLLDHTDNPGEVQTSTERPGLLGIRVPTSLARRAGLVDVTADSTEPDETARLERERAAAEAKEKADADAKARAEQAQAESDAAAKAEADRVAAEKAAAETATKADTEEKELTPAQKAAQTKKAREEAARAAAAAVSADSDNGGAATESK